MPLKVLGNLWLIQIIEARKKGPFEDFYDFCRRMGSNRLNKRILIRLIGSGAMDSLGKREALFNLIEPFLKRVEQLVERSESKISDLFSEDLYQEKDYRFTKSSKPKRNLTSFLMSGVH